MEQNMEKNTGSNAEPKIELKNKKNSKILIIGAAIILIGLGIWYSQTQKGKIVAPSVNAPEAGQSITKEDSTSALNQELDSIDIGDLDKEFQTIDSDLNSL